MLQFIAVLVIAPAPTIDRDEYGVPHIKASTIEQAFFEAGYAVAQDRLWQMENSRRVARGRMAEAFGPNFAASDREVLAQAYTDQELDEQIARGLDARSQTILREYVRGVNAWIGEATAKNLLPPGYSQNGLKPEPWTERDSAAITIRLFQQFGKGGAGEIRNMALLSYLQGRTETKNRILDVLEDFAWFNDKSSPTTISDADDPLGKSHPVFPLPNRAESERHIAALPKVSLLELLPGVRLAERVESSRIAELVSAPFKWGSYAMVVGPSRSGNSQPCLLSAPQMGLRTPSIIHEMSITAPGYQAVGMDVPGVPGIAIGYTPYLAWGLTSGVADTDDIVFTSTDSSGYVADGKHQEFEVQRFPLAVKGGSATTVEQRRTVFGPVVVDSNAAKVAFSRKSASRMRELESLRSVLEIGSVSKVENVDDALRHATVNFNCFYATRDGHVGYRFTGLVPDRKAGYDPRFPLPATPTALWTGTIPFEKMPAVRDPKMGLLANWNNKPVSWWPNSDTPVWGQIFRNQEILKALGSNKLIPTDLERAAWTIARRDETWDYFKPLVQNVWQGSPLEGFDGWMLDGSIQAQVYRAFFDDLREAIFLPVTGNFIAPDNFKLIAQPSVMLKALQGKTKIDYLRGRKAAEVIKEALDKSTRRLAGSNLSPRFVAPPISVPGQPPIPDSNRGTYIQIVELMPSGPQGRNVVTPGVAEAGDHSLDQVPLARAWIFKLMRF